MPVKGEGPGTDPRVIDRFEGGVGWIAHPEEEMQRASHALVTDGEVWIVDPVDAEGVEDLYADLGEVAGVVVLIDRHERDAGAFADRHDVPVYVPESLRDGVSIEGVRVVSFEDRLPETDYRTVPIVDLPFWREVALHDPGGGTLVVPEAVGTAEFFVTGGERLGVHPMLRAFPPRDELGGIDPDRVLVGHGVGIVDDAPRALRDALRNSRRGAPALYAGTLRSFLPG